MVRCTRIDLGLGLQNIDCTGLGLGVWDSILAASALILAGRPE